MSDRLIVSTEADLHAWASIEGWQAEQKLRARREARVRKGGRAADVHTPTRALPSGPALNATGFALALLLLGVVALTMGFVGLGWLAWSLITLPARAMRRKPESD